MRSLLLATLTLAAPALQDRAPTIELEALDGKVETRSVVGFKTADPRAEGAAFVRFVGLEPPAAPAGLEDEAVLVTLHSRDQIRGWVRGGAGERVSVDLVGGVDIELAADDLRSLVFTARTGGEGAVELEAPEDGDRLYRRRGGGLDRLDGLLDGFSEEGVGFESSLGARTYAWPEVVGLFIEDLGEELEADRDDGRTRVVADLRGGSRLRGGLVSLDSRGCTLAVRGGAELLLPAHVLHEIAVDDGSFSYLSELAPADTGPGGPFDDDLGMTYPPRIDRAVVTGGALRVGGRTWGRGIGVHAPSRLTWKLDGGWSHLRAWAGIDDSALEIARTGSVVFRVLVDGETRFESPVRRGGDDALELPSIDLADARELVLEVDEATDFWVADRADWLRPILVRAR